MLLKYGVVGVLLMAVQPLWATELKGSPSELSNYLLDQRKIVTIYGESEIKAEADKAIFTLTIKTEDDKYNEALTKNREMAKQVEKRLKSSGVRAADIKVARFSSTPGYGWFKDKPTSYEVNNDMKVTIRNNKQIQALAKIVDDMKKVFLTKTEFEHSQKEKSKLDVLDKALKQVTQKKSVYERNLGMRLQVVRVMDQRVRAVSPRPQRLAKRKRVASEAMMDSYPSSAPAPQGFGEMMYSASVSVEYVVSGRKR
ncbi:MAG: SIMPL domain-containing protein [Proteobacteria bacterium]|nr:SIMPL domain-containing protein [Pseudomonadota bacterium]